MGNWRKWIRPGLAASVVLTVLAYFLHSGAVERDLKGRVETQLAADGQSWALVEVSGRDVTVKGVAPAVEAQKIALQSAGRVNGVRAVADGSDLLAIASPYVWSARKAGRAITVLGSVPSEGFRNSVLAAARRALPTAEIRDEMNLARGAPPSFNVAAAFALTRLAGLAEGTVMLTDGTLSVSGVAADAGSYAGARQAFARQLPTTMTLGPVDILPARADPFVWSADFDGKTVTLAGFVPNEVVDETLVAAIKASLTGAAVVDKAAVASGEPSGFAEAASFAVTALNRFTQGGVTLDGLSLDVSGVAKSVDDYDALLEGLGGSLPPGLKIVSSAITPATVSPYGWHGTKDGAKVVLTGYVPSVEGRTEIAAVAASLFAGDTVTNQVRVAAGEPHVDWLGAIKFAMGELARLGHGDATLAEQSYSVAGEAASPQDFAEIMSMNAQTLPASLTLAKAEILPPSISPYQFIAARGADNLTLAGYVASQDDRQAILAAAASKFGTTAVVDKLVFAGGAPANFVSAATTALQAVSRLAGGRADITDGTIKITGGAYYPSAADEIADSTTSALPPGFTLAAAVITRQDDQTVSATRCRDLLQETLGQGEIAFAGTKAEIATDSYGFLDRIAAIIARCPDTKIEVGAHSDSEGSSARNRDRTQARAEAIVDYLVAAGVMRERLTAVGYGETKPVAANDTTAGKAANRRIEFTVQLSEGG